MAVLKARRERLIQPGTEVIIGGREAIQGRYDPVVGMHGIVIQSSSRVYVVNVEQEKRGKKYSNHWYINAVDVLPATINDNEDATRFLRRDEEWLLLKPQSK